MTWQDLIDRLESSIPPERRNDQAVFFSEGEEVSFIIDEMELIPLDGEHGHLFDSTVGDDDMKTTYALIP